MFTKSLILIVFCSQLICERLSERNVSSFILLFRNLLLGISLKASYEIYAENTHIWWVVFGRTTLSFLLFCRTYTCVFFFIFYQSPLILLLFHMTLVFSFVINDEAVFHSFLFDIVFTLSHKGYAI